MSPWALLIVGLIIGAIAGYLVARAQAPQSGSEQGTIRELRSQVASQTAAAASKEDKLVAAERARAAAEARADEASKKLDEEKALLAQARKEFADSFAALAADALTKNNQAFLTLAEQKFGQLKDSAANELDARRVAIDQLVRPIQQTLETYQRETKELESRRIKDMSSLGQQLTAMADAQGSLQQETAKLVNALRSPQVRGRWGEIALRRTAELAGMSEHCDFAEQETVTTENGRFRPDMIVRLPSGREVVVDSKVALDGFLKSLEARSDADRAAALDLHAAQLRQHVSALASKQYWEQFAHTPEFVVLFIPNDSFLAAAAEREPALIEEALAKRVVIATPTTFIALLRAIAYGWRQEQVTESAQQISQLGRDLYERIVTFVEHMDDLGAGLRRAVKSYNTAVGSLQSRLLPMAEKFEDLGVTSPKHLPEIEQVGEQPRMAAQRSLLPGMEPDQAKAAGGDE